MSSISSTSSASVERAAGGGPTEKTGFFSMLSPTITTRRKENFHGADDAGVVGKMGGFFLGKKMV
jgi:hypothetical protein